MENMIKFYRGLVGNLPETGVNGALYITTDEGAIYYGTGTGMKRLGDFVQVANVEALPEKAHESCLYYCVAENILAKWNGTEWKQINKQPTAEELKGLLGLGSMAYLSEVAEANLNSDLAAKINAASGAQHSHANKALLDTYTQTEADLADAVAKKHAHTFNETELNKIVEGDVAKWNGVAADHLTSEDKTALENAIKEAKKAGTDANTNIETYKVSNDARVKAVEDDIAEIIDGTNGILAQAKSYSDGKLATAKTEISAEIDADVKVVADELAGYKTSNDAALAGVKATAEAAAVKTEVETALAGKVDKVEGKSLIADTEIARLANVTNYDDTQVKADIAKKADATAMTTELGKKVDKVEGYSLVSDTEIARLAEVDNYDDGEVRGLIGDNADAIAEIAGDYVKSADIANFETKDNVKKVSDDLAAYIESNDAAVADRYTKEEADGKFALIADAYDDTELVGRVKAIEDDYLKASDKEDLQTQINTIMNNPDAEGAINSINEFTQYVKDHGTIADGFRTDIDKNKEDIAANAKAIADQATADAAKYETKDDASAKLTEAKGYTDTEVAKDRERIAVLEAIDHDAYVDADAALKAELQAEIDADVKVVNDALEAYKTSNDAEVAKKANSADVYAKTETYNKSEIEALLTWGSF